MIYTIGLLLTLVPSAVMDIRTKNLPVIWLSVMAAAGLIMRIILKDQPWMILLTTVLAAMVCLLTVILSKGLGWGDVFLVGACGVFSGPADLVPAMLISTLAAVIFGGIRIAMKKATFKSRLPFAPFLLLGFAVTKILDAAGGSL